MNHHLRITREEWQQVYLAGYPNQRPAWAHALILTALGPAEDDDSILHLSSYQAEQIVESFETPEPPFPELEHVPFPGLEHGTLTDKLYTLWDNVEHDIFLDRTHGCT